MTTTQPEYYVVSGSREWPQESLWVVTQKMIELIPHGATVVTGGARGVDRWADREADRLRWPTVVVPADWDRLGKKAGVIRNQQMLDLDPEAVLVFQWNGSKGAGDMARRCVRQDVVLHHFTETVLRPDIAALDMGDIE